jgi:hypothetical protein
LDSALGKILIGAAIALAVILARRSRPPVP